MKVVINKCYGGFGVSRDALVALEKTDCPHVDRTDPKQYFGGGATFVLRHPEYSWEAEFKKDQERPETGLFSRSLVLDGKIVTDGHGYGPESRACVHLVAVVEDLGQERASGKLSKLKVVAVPDGVGFEIDEYDGLESVEETHRSWG